MTWDAIAYYVWYYLLIPHIPVLTWDRFHLLTGFFSDWFWSGVWGVSFSGDPQKLSFNNWGSSTVRTLLQVLVSGNSAVHLCYSTLGFIKGKLDVICSPSMQCLFFFFNFCVCVFLYRQSDSHLLLQRVFPLALYNFFSLFISGIKPKSSSNSTGCFYIK